MTIKEFTEKFGKSDLKFKQVYKNTKRYDVVCDDKSVIEFVSNSINSFTTNMNMESHIMYLTDVSVFNNEGDSFTVYRVRIER